MEKTPEEAANEAIAEISKRYLVDCKSFEEALNRVGLDIRETMRSIALGSGALSAAALVLLSSKKE